MDIYEEQAERLFELNNKVLESGLTGMTSVIKIFENTKLVLKEIHEKGIDEGFKLGVESEKIIKSN